MFNYFVVYCVFSEIIEQIKAGDSEPALRPSLSELPEAVSTQAVIQPLNTLITSCWHEDPKERPTIDQTLKKLTKTNPFKYVRVILLCLEFIRVYDPGMVFYTLI